MGKDEGAKPLSGRGKYKRRIEEGNIEGEFKRDIVPLQRKSSPSPYQGEGDKGDGVDK